MKKPTVIITDPEQMRAIYTKPSTQLREEALRSVYVQNGLLPAQDNSDSTPEMSHPLAPKLNLIPKP